MILLIKFTEDGHDDPVQSEENPEDEEEKDAGSKANMNQVRIQGASVIRGVLHGKGRGNGMRGASSIGGK